MTGDYIRKRLISNGYILKDIADKLKMTPQAFDSKLKSKDISVGTLVSICTAINKTVDFFLYEYSPEVINNAEYSEKEMGKLEELRNMIEKKDIEIATQNKYIGKLEFLLEQNNIEVENTVKRGVS